MRFTRAGFSESDAAASLSASVQSDISSVSTSGLVTAPLPPQRSESVVLIIVHYLGQRDMRSSSQLPQIRLRPRLISLAALDHEVWTLGMLFLLYC